MPLAPSPDPARPRRFRIEGGLSPAGAAISRALGAEGWEVSDEAPGSPDGAPDRAPVGLWVEARPLSALPALLDPPSTVALAEAMAPLVDLGAAEVAPGGLMLLVTTWAPGAPRGWTAAMLALRRAWVEEAAREARGVRVAGLAAPVGARLPGFLRQGAAPQGVAPEEVARAALWLLASPSLGGRTIELG